MFISNILKQNRANKELQDRLKQNIESTATLLRAVDNDNQNTEAIENYEEVNKIKKKTGRSSSHSPIQKRQSRVQILTTTEGCMKQK